jgi:hypothetical protein
MINIHNRHVIFLLLAGASALTWRRVQHQMRSRPSAATIVSLSFLACCLVILPGCSAKRVYAGPSRPRKEVATLWVDLMLHVSEIDSVKVRSGGLRETFLLEPGSHSFRTAPVKIADGLSEIKDGKMVLIQPAQFEVYRGAFNAEAGGTYFVDGIHLTVWRTHGVPGHKEKAGSLSCEKIWMWPDAKGEWKEVAAPTRSSGSESSIYTTTPLISPPR